MNLYTIVLKNMRQRALATTLTIFSIALGIALAGAILIVREGAEENFTSYARGWDLIVGYRGSGLEIVLNTMFNLTNATNTIPFGVYEDILDDPRVKFAVPFCTGVAYQDEFKVVATKRDFYDKFEYVHGHYEEVDDKRSYVAGKGLELARGSWFNEEVRGEAVIGSRVETHTPLKLESQFYASPGYIEDEWIRTQGKYYGSPLKVVGVLAPTGTPSDKTIYVSMKTWFKLPGMVVEVKGTDEEGRRQAAARREKLEKLLARRRAESVDPDERVDLLPDLEIEADPGARGPEKEGEEEEKEERYVEPTFVGPVKPIPVYYQITSIGVRLHDPGDAPAIIAELKENSELAQAVEPVGEVQAFFDTTLRWISGAFLMIAVMVIIASALSIMVWIYNSMNERRFGIAIMRSLGASRGTIFATILVESATLCGIGGIVGVPLGHFAVMLAGDYIYRASGAVIHSWSFSFYEIFLVLGAVVLGTLVGILPAMKAYETDIAANLNPLMG